MTKKEVVVIVIAVAVMAFLVITYIRNGRQPIASNSNEEETAPASFDQNLLSGSMARTRESAPLDVIVPEENSTVPQNVAQPQAIAAGNPGNDSSYRSFNIRAQAGEFTPNTVIVNEGDTVDIRVTAVDRDYDFIQPDFGFNTAIPKSTTKKIQFGATVSGKFTFYCKVCGGLSKGPVGYVIIKPKK